MVSNVLVQGELGLIGLAQKAVHGDFKVWVFVFDRQEVLQHLDIEREFFLNLTDEGFFTSFARLHFTARELIFMRDVVVLTGPALQAKKFIVALNDGSDYFVVFHE